MIGARSVIAIIPARGGSKGLPGKNIKPLCGKPLIAWTIEKAKCSKLIDCIMVTTDSDEIASVAARYGAEVPFLRPQELATDTATTFAAVEHALSFYKKERSRTFEYLILLEPTSPLREDGDIDSILSLLDSESKRFDSVVSVGEVATEHPSIIKKLQDKKISPYCTELPQVTRRQDLLPAYFPYGVGYASKVEAYLKTQTFYTERCGGFPIQRYQNYEIDDICDFLAIEAIMKHQWGLS